MFTVDDPGFDLKVPELIKSKGLAKQYRSLINSLNKLVWKKVDERPSYKKSATCMSVFRVILITAIVVSTVVGIALAAGSKKDDSDSDDSIDNWSPPANDSSDNWDPSAWPDLTPSPFPDLRPITFPPGPEPFFAPTPWPTSTPYPTPEPTTFLNFPKITLPPAVKPFTPSPSTFWETPTPTPHPTPAPSVSTAATGSPSVVPPGSTEPQPAPASSVPAEPHRRRLSYSSHTRESGDSEMSSRHYNHRGHHYHYHSDSIDGRTHDGDSMELSSSAKSTLIWMYLIVLFIIIVYIVCHCMFTSRRKRVKEEIFKEVERHLGTTVNPEWKPKGFVFDIRTRQARHYYNRGRSWSYTEYYLLIEVTHVNRVASPSSDHPPLPSLEPIQTSGSFYGDVDLSSPKGKEPSRSEGVVTRGADLARKSYSAPMPPPPPRWQPGSRPSGTTPPPPYQPPRIDLKMIEDEGHHIV